MANDDDAGDAMSTPPLAVIMTTPRNILKINKRSIKVFRALFRKSNIPHHPGEVTWPDLLRTMISVVLSAEKLRFSASHFTRPVPTGERSIQSHESHAISKLFFALVLHFGRRLCIAHQRMTEILELRSVHMLSELGRSCRESSCRCRLCATLD